MINNKDKNKKGFTLIEIIVSLAIFTIVAVVAVGAFIKILDANKKAQALQTATNNLNFALESISREMRVGSVYVLSDSVINVPAGHNNKLSKNEMRNKTETLGIDFSGDNDDFYLIFNSSRIGNCGGDNSKNLVNIYRFYIVNSNGKKNIKIGKYEQESCNDVVNNNVTFTDVISPNVTLEYVSIQTIVGPIPNFDQPYVSMYFKGYSGVSEASRSYFDIQTSVSQRQSIKDL